MTKNLPMSSDEDGKATGQLPLGFWTQIAVFGRGLGGSPERWTLLWLAVSVFAVILLTAAAQVALNAWNGPFYNAISARDDEAFLHELVVFFEIAGSLLVLNVVQMWLNLMMQLKLRAGLMHDLLGRWLEPLNAFRLAHAGNLGVNPDQRLHEDARHLSAGDRDRVAAHREDEALRQAPEHDDEHRQQNRGLEQADGERRREFGWYGRPPSTRSPARSRVSASAIR